MRFFIDFEGTQFSHEIISVGIIAEDGATFYSTVRPKKSKVTSFITELTGLTNEEIAEAPTADEVFGDLFDWIFAKAGQENARFYVYGNGDSDFIIHTIKNCQTFKANLCLCRILGNLVDYNPKTVHALHLERSIGLSKVLSAFRGEEITQAHNSLEDALFLKELVSYIENGIRPKVPIDEKYFTPGNIPEPPLIDRDKTTKYFAFGKEFENLREAASWVMNYKMCKKNRKQTTLNNIAKKIENKINKQEPYFGEIWRKEK